MDQNTRETLFSSKNFDWETPQWLYDQLDKEFHFTCDVCATKENAKHINFYSIENDGLSKTWEGVCYCNPPYGRNVKHWVKKARDESQSGHAKVVMLVPARTDVKWFHDFIYRETNREIRFLKGRLKFGKSNNSAPFPSMIVIFQKYTIL
jgi:site-specific DNA-methyltransferase (adenine-specific)